MGVKDNGHGEIVDKASVECPKCGYDGEIPSHWLGREVKCTSCEEWFEASVI